MNKDDVSIRDRIEPHLPRLRRYARALAGSQERGDDRVRALLEALITSPNILPSTGHPRQELFHLFHTYHDPHQTVFDDHMGTRLPHHPQQALLLTVVEEFSLKEAAQIMGESEHRVETAIQAARVAIAKVIRSRVLIIEDEPLIAMHLEQLMEDMGHSVVAIAATREQAERAAEAHAPELILADIQLADGSSGIEATRTIVAMFDVPVIFITAFPERLLTGTLSEPAYLVTKPFAPDAVSATVGQALLARHPDYAPLA